MVLMKNLICGAFAAALLGSAAMPALAADLPSTKSAPVYAIPDTFDPFLIRVRALGVLPNSSGTTLSGSSIYGSSLSNNVVPEVDFTYFITRNWAVEVIAGVSHHRLTGSLTPNGAKQDIANTTLLPPTATLQYHFNMGAFDPYLGVGANYTWFLFTKSTLGATLGNANLVNIHGSAGLALQAGFDYYLTKNWVINVDAKKLFLETSGNLATSAGTNALHLNINPWLVGVGVGYRFGGSEAVVAKY